MTWPASATIAIIWTSTTLARSGYYGRNWADYGHEPSLGFFFFNKKREFGGWYLLVEETISGNVACHPDKERDSRGYGKINSLGT